jgi:hypothetical protein
MVLNDYEHSELILTLSESELAFYDSEEISELAKPTILRKSSF